MMLRVRAARGFTLLELMIVMVLLAVLGSISLPVYQGYITDTAADTFLAEVAEFERFYRIKAAEKNIDFCEVTWSDLDAGSADKVGYPSSSFMKVERIDANLNRKSCGSDPVARSRAGGDQCDGLSLRVKAASETDGVEAVLVAQAVFNGIERQGMLKDWSLNTESIVVFTVNFRHGCEGASGQSQSSPTSVGAEKSLKAQSIPAKTVCSAPEQRLGDQCVTPVACVDGQLSADLASCNCPVNTTLYQGSCVKNASCGPGGALAADPSQCGQCGSGMGLVQGQCVTPVACVDGQLSADLASCNCPVNTTLYQGSCVKNASCGPGGALAADPSQCGQCGSGMGLVQGQCVTPVACVDGQLSADLASCNCPVNTTLYQGSCVKNASCGPGGALAADPSQCGQCGSGMGLVQGQCVTPVACVDGQLSADLASCNCPANTTLYQGSCVQNASCGPGGALAADPSQCGQCGSGMGLVQGQCVTPVACVDGQLSADLASCNCPANTTLYQGSCVKNASCGPGGALAADPSQCGQCGSGMGLVQGQCVTPVACVDGQLSADLASCNCPANTTLYQGSCVKNASCGPGGALAADPSQCRQCGQGMHLNNGVCEQGKSRADCVRETTVKGNGRPHWSAVARCMGRSPSEWQAVRRGN